MSGTGERLWTVREVAALLGFAPGTVLDWFENERIPGFRLTGRVGAPVRFRQSDLEAWLAGARGPWKRSA